MWRQTRVVAMHSTGLDAGLDMVHGMAVRQDFVLGATR
jgi:hypothetical protein